MVKKIFFLFFLFLFLFPIRTLAAETRFLYDGDGNRVAKIEEGKTTLYVGEMEKDLSSDQVTKYYSLGGKRVALRESTNDQGPITKYLISDHLGSTRGLTGSTGQANSQITYFPYGSIRSNSGQIPSRQYTGQVNDNSTGLYFYNARYYDPRTANFIQADNDLSSLNKYGYVFNNPIRFFDPNGNEAVDSLALYLCQAERTDCNNLAPEVWGGSGVSGQSGVANKSLSIANRIKSDMNRGMNYRYWASQQISRVGQSNLEYFYSEKVNQENVSQAVQTNINSANRVRIRGVNTALILAIAGQESGWGSGDSYSVQAHSGNEIYLFTTPIENLLNEWMEGIDPNVVDLILSTRVLAGYTSSALNNLGQTFYAVLPNGSINFELLKNYPGEGNYNELWMTKVQAYYNAFTKFANDNPDEYGWLLDDLTQYQYRPPRSSRGGPRPE